MQKPAEFVREQVTTVREKVDRVAGSVAGTVAAAPSASAVGEFIREQRNAARVSLRELARTAEVTKRPPSARDDPRRRYYRVTPFGVAVARAEMRRLTQLVRLARARGLTPETA